MKTILLPTALCKRFNLTDRPKVIVLRCMESRSKSGRLKFLSCIFEFNCVFWRADYRYDSFGNAVFVRVLRSFDPDLC